MCGDKKMRRGMDGVKSPIMVGDEKLEFGIIDFELIL
jgi:hypothetical protein